MAQITEIVTITELARLTKKSRPTIYKWLTLYEKGDEGELPQAVAQLFGLITKTGSKKEIYQFCEERFFDETETADLREIFDLLRTHQDELNLEKVKQFIMKELRK